MTEKGKVWSSLSLTSHPLGCSRNATPEPPPRLETAPHQVGGGIYGDEEEYVTVAGLDYTATCHDNMATCLDNTATCLDYTATSVPLDDTYEILATPQNPAHPQNPWSPERLTEFPLNAVPDWDETYEVLATPKSRHTHESDTATLESADSYEMLTNPRAGWLTGVVQDSEARDLETGDTYEVLTTPKPHPLGVKGHAKPTLARGQSVGNFWGNRPHPLEVKGHICSDIRGLYKHPLAQAEQKEDVYASVDQMEVMYAELQLPAKTGGGRDRLRKLGSKLWRAGSSESLSAERAASLPSLFKKKGNKKTSEKERGAETEDEYMPMSALAVEWRAKPARQERQEEHQATGHSSNGEGEMMWSYH